MTDVTERVKRAFREHRIKYPYMREYAVGGNRDPEYAESERRAESRITPPKRHLPGPDT